MNILLITPIYSTHYDAGWFWLRALNQLGHSVTVWDYRLDKNPPPLFHYPEVTLVLKGENIDPKKLPSPHVCYWPDALDRTPGIENHLRKYDKVFALVKPIPDWMEWLPTGWDPAIHRDLQVERKGTTYIGTCNSIYKKDMIEAIRPDLVHGNNWDYSYLPPVYLHDFVRCANVAKVLIDVHQAPNAGPNRKFFEMIACGFTIVDRVPGVEEVLGKDLSDQVSFKTPEEAKELITYFVDKYSEREELWRLERERIKPYTYQAAAETVLNSIKGGRE